jgi:cytoskeletal protein RodZ
MEALGQKLKNSREEKGATIDQVARDTHIAKRYIAALEEEAFEVFPGDTYVLGFLRNYADYLGLDSQELLNLYKNLRIQEQPAPIDELLERRTIPPIVFIAAGVFLVAVLAVGGFFLFRGSGTKDAQTVKTVPLAKQYAFQDEILEQSFIPGDEILVSRNGNSYVIKIEKIAGTVGLIGPVDKLSLKQGEEVFVELTPKGETLKVLCRSIQRNEKPPTAVLRIDKNIQSPSADRVVNSPSSETVPGTAAATSAGSSVPIGSSSEMSRIRRSQVILEAAARAPFILEAEFRGYCLFRYESDNQNREERYFRRGETFRTDVRNEIKLWYSNSGSFRVRISGKEIEFGKPGEVGASLIKWVQNETGGGFRLELIPMY